MLNKFVINGRLTQDPKKVEGKNYGYLNLAVGRNYKNKDGDYQTDFISALVPGRTMEFIEKHFKKGDGITIIGNVETQVKKEGENTETLIKLKVTDVEFETVGRKYRGDDAQKPAASTDDAPAAEDLDDDDDDLPF